MPKKYNTYRKNRKHRNKKGGMDSSRTKAFRELMKRYNIRSYEDEWNSHHHNNNPSNKLPQGRINSSIAPGDLYQ